jgi:hypothetical protein
MMEERKHGFVLIEPGFVVSVFCVDMTDSFKDDIWKTPRK